VYRELGAARLTTGERLQLGVVRGPDAEWRARIAALLGHKPGHYRYHVEAALARPLDELDTRFYVGHLDGEPLSQVMVAGARGAAILGHVYTVPEWRRRGAYRALMSAQMDDTRAAGYRLLTLSTRFDSHPYWIYHHFGFRSVAPGSGAMRWQAEQGDEDAYLRPAATTARELRWSDWGALNMTALRAIAPGEELPRSLLLGLKGQQDAEGAFADLRWQLDRQSGPGVGSQARVLESETGAVAGWALLAPERRWFGDAWTLDVYCLPGFWDRAAALVEGLRWPDAPVALYAAGQGPARARLAQSRGFAAVGVLPRWLRLEGRQVDVAVWVRPPP
jgi:hypothetical protein